MTTRIVNVGRRAVSEGGTLAADLQPGDAVTLAEGGERRIISATPYRSEGADMVRLELHGDVYALMPASCDVDADPLDTSALSESVALALGL